MAFDKLIKLLPALVLAAAALPAFAQTWPAKPVRVIIPYAPGGPTDVVARAIGPGLEAAWKQSFIIENHPGAGGMVGTAEVARSQPDGYTLLFQSNGVMLAPLFQKSIPYDPADLRPIVGVASSYYLIVTGPNTPAKTLREFIAWAKSNKGHVNAGTILYTPLDLDTNAFLQKAGIEATLISYNGGSALVEGTARGDVQVVLGTPSVAIELAKAGKITALAYTSSQRSPQLPNVPTLKEQGVDLTPGYTLGLWVQAKTPEDIVGRITNDVANVAASPDAEAKLRNLAYEPPVHRQYGQQMQNEQKNYVDIARRIGLKPQ